MRARRGAEVPKLVHATSEKLNKYNDLQIGDRLSVNEPDFVADNVKIIEIKDVRMRASAHIARHS